MVTIGTPFNSRMEAIKRDATAHEFTMKDYKCIMSHERSLLTIHLINL